MWIETAFELLMNRLTGVHDFSSHLVSRTNIPVQHWTQIGQHLPVLFLLLPNYQTLVILQRLKVLAVLLQ